MKKHSYYSIAIIIGVICAAYFMYIRVAPMLKAAPKAAPVEPVAAHSFEKIFPAPGATSYRMGLYLDISDRILYGSTELETTNTSGRPLDELWFTIYPNAFRSQQDTPAPADAYDSGFNPGWIEFEKILVNGQAVNFDQDGISIRLQLPENVNPGDKLKVEMNWKEKIPSLAYRFGYKDGVFMLGNFYPTLDVLGADGWHKPYNSAFGDPFCSACADYLVRLNIPDGYSMTSPGSVIGALAEDNGRQTFLLKAQNVRDFCLVVMYDYKEISRVVNGVAIKCYTPSARAEQAAGILERSGEILNYYSCSFGSYPYEDFKIVFVPMKGFHGMEYSGMVFLRQEFLDSGPDQRESDFILAHEIAHQWWYAMVGSDQINEPWLDEGLANWSAYKYLGKYRGRKPPGYNEYKNGVNLARALQQIYSTDDYYRIVYSGGEAFWFSLEKELGEDLVNRILRSYLTEYRFKIATTSDLLAIIGKEAHRNMDDYFYKWFNQS